MKKVLIALSLISVVATSYIHISTITNERLWEIEKYNYALENTYETVYESIEEERENLKCADGVAKTYMNYKMITAKSSKQYKYIQEYMSVNEKGFLVDKDNRVGIALGSYFGAIGNKFDIELENGTVLKVVKVEAKDDSHTFNGCEQRWDKSVIEFVIDTDVASEYYGVASNGYINQGNYNNLNEFKGAIKSIYKVD